MSLLLSQLTPAVDTGPIGFGINCLEYGVYNEDGTIDESFVFFISEDFTPSVTVLVFQRASRIQYAT